MARNPAAISPTAHYTGYTWFHHQLSHPGLVTTKGRLMHRALSPVRAIAHLTNTGTVEDFLIARHRVIDHWLTQAIESGQVTQVIEVAAGLSPRGWRFKHRYGDKIRYIEADLPGMAQIKRQRLAQAGLQRTGHDVVDLDALAETGPHSLTQLAQGLDTTQGVAIITEGLLNYFDQGAVQGMWQRFAALLSRHPHGLYLSDLHLSEAQRSPLAKAFKALLTTFVRGRVFVHFKSTDEARRHLLGAGFTQAQLHSPADLAKAVGMSVRKGAALVKVIKASTTPSHSR
jgi:O-methyltransferase involved in polyketide biosynthesis